jgi:hypothetical protein
MRFRYANPRAKLRVQSDEIESGLFGHASIMA